MRCPLCSRCCIGESQDTQTGSAISQINGNLHMIAICSHVALRLMLSKTQPTAMKRLTTTICCNAIISIGLLLDATASDADQEQKWVLIMDWAILCPVTISAVSTLTVVSILWFSRCRSPARTNRARYRRLKPWLSSNLDRPQAISAFADCFTDDCCPECIDFDREQQYLFIKLFAFKSTRSILATFKKRNVNLSCVVCDEKLMQSNFAVRCTADEGRLYHLVCFVSHSAGGSECACCNKNLSALLFEGICKTLCTKSIINTST